MTRRHTVILGAGISGLAAAYRLHVAGERVTVIEASSRPGGWIRTERANGFLFELGPRGFRPKGKGQETVALIQDLKLEPEVVAADPAARHRFLLREGRLDRVPLSRAKLIYALATEPFAQRSSAADESVYDFFMRRFGRHVTESYCDAVVTGIFAGDPRQLSISSCFPQLREWESTYGSLLWGAIRQGLRRGNKKTAYSKAPLLSFRNGMETLPKALAARLGSSLHLDCRATALLHSKGRVEISTSQGRLVADQLISTLPAPDLARLLTDTAPPFPFASLVLICCGWQQFVLPQTGFGYLVPPQEHPSLLGMVWDSAVFPTQNHYPQETRVTLMMGGMRSPATINETDEALLESAREILQEQLGVLAPPDTLVVHRVRSAIPQYPVGHADWVGQLRRAHPYMVLAGTSFGGVAVNDCVQKQPYHILHDGR